MREPAISNSATAPVLGIVLGVVLYGAGFAGFGVLLIIGSGFLLALRLFGLVVRLFGGGKN